MLLLVLLALLRILNSPPFPKVHPALIKVFQLPKRRVLLNEGSKGTTRKLHSRDHEWLSEI